MKTAIILDAISTLFVPRQNTERKYKCQIDFKTACCIWRQYFSSNDFSDLNFTHLLLNMIAYLTPIRLGRKDQRNLKAKLVVSFPYRLAA
ncbi:IS4 family transposase [Lactobacillus gigeriorum DSM 23908 = CRBIP 24.85]|uniref:IS4 family transposase n=1 Tax=Lactobacillus gigeriorum DSM 23908 = CRBIP 24.85 TaxID=1423751 RepID=I7KQM7_9LACO|nr:IS4 family transposase [Lactobacillus gigeriorum DSM 23908 = CRBIP 24.85]